MNSPDCDDISVLRLTGSVAALYPALVQLGVLRASKKSADPRLFRNLQRLLPVAASPRARDPNTLLTFELKLEVAVNGCCKQYS
jgi:hypothetical protein